jgi:hypothetical protein
LKQLAKDSEGSEGRTYPNFFHKSRHLSKIKDGIKDPCELMLTIPTTFPSKSMTTPPSSYYNIYTNNITTCKRNIATKELQN